MSEDNFVLHEWEKEKMDALKKLAELEDAKTEGFSDGYSNGISDGFSNGVLEIAKNMLSLDMPLETISKCTNLSLDEIKKLQEEIK